MLELRGKNTESDGDCVECLAVAIFHCNLECFCEKK
jgi:hypothetical protein